MKTAAKKSGLALGDSVGAMLRMTHLAFAQDLQNHLAGYDIPVGMWFYLRALWEEDGITQRVLSQRVCATEATTAQQLTKMEARGFIERRRSATDRRNSHVHLTRSGRALEARLLPYAAAVNATALAGISAADIATLRDLLARMRANLLERHEARLLEQDLATRAPRKKRATASAKRERA